MKRFAMALGAAILIGGGLAGTVLAQPQTGRAAMADPFGAAAVSRQQAEAMAARLFVRVDANGDGRLDRADRAARQAKRFDRLDTNRDGALSRQEFAAGRERRQVGRGMDHDGHHGGTHKAGRRGGGMFRGMMAHADTNGDRVITRAEFMTGAMRHFTAADINRDGTLTREERRSAFRALGHGRMGDMTPPK